VTLPDTEKVKEIPAKDETFAEQDVAHAGRVGQAVTRRANHTSTPATSPYWRYRRE